MPIWLLSALGLLRTAAVGGTGRALITGAGAGQLIGGAIDFPGGPDGRPRRRRRRRALTAQDRDDIAFASAFVSKAAIERLVVVLATRA